MQTVNFICPGSIAINPDRAKRVGLTTAIDQLFDYMWCDIHMLNTEMLPTPNRLLARIRRGLADYRETTASLMADDQKLSPQRLALVLRLAPWPDTVADLTITMRVLIQRSEIPDNWRKQLTQYFGEQTRTLMDVTIAQPAPSSELLCYMTQLGIRYPKLPLYGEFREQCYAGDIAAAQIMCNTGRKAASYAFMERAMEDGLATV